jgi:hypothetical protein
VLRDQLAGISATPVSQQKQSASMSPSVGARRSTRVDAARSQEALVQVYTNNGLLQSDRNTESHCGAGLRIEPLRCPQAFRELATCSKTLPKDTVTLRHEFQSTNARATRAARPDHDWVTPLDVTTYPIAVSTAPITAANRRGLSEPWAEAVEYLSYALGEAWFGTPIAQSGPARH